MLTLPEVAELLSISKTTLYRLIYGRKIKCYKISGLLRFKQEDVEDYINRSSIEPFIWPE